MKRYILTLLSCVLALVAYGADDSNTIGKMREELFSVSCKIEDDKQIENQDDFRQNTKRFCHVSQKILSLQNKEK